MKCPACNVVVKFNWQHKSTSIIRNQNLKYYLNDVDDTGTNGLTLSNYGVSYETASCPNCYIEVLLQKISNYNTFRGIRSLDKVLQEQVIFPLPKQNFELSDDVPEDLRKDFKEAYEILHISPKSSATLSRRCLQLLFHKHLEIKGYNLNKEIDIYLNNEKPPSHIANTIDSIREYGNMGAHPQQDKATGEILEVEEGEAEWMLELLTTLFDFHFVLPKMHQKRMAELNLKKKSKK